MSKWRFWTTLSVLVVGLTSLLGAPTAAAHADKSSQPSRAAMRAAITNPSNLAVQYANSHWSWTNYDHSSQEYCDSNGYNLQTLQCWDPPNYGTDVPSSNQWFQPYFECAEYVARALAAEGFFPGLTPSSPPNMYGHYSSANYNLLNVGDDGRPGGQDGLYDYLVTHGGLDIGDHPDKALPGDPVFYGGPGNRDHVELLVQTGSGQAQIDAHNIGQSRQPYGAGGYIVHIGNGVAQTSNALYALLPDRSAVLQYSGSGTTWNVIGGPALALYGGGYGLFATDPSTGNIYRYNGTGMSWTQVGTAGRTFVVTDTALYGISVDGTKVMQYSGSGMSWFQIGGPASALYASRAYGRPGLFATDPNTGNIYQYSGTPMQWSPEIGAAASAIYGGGGGLYATNPNTGNIYDYQGVPMDWAQAGTAGSMFAVTSSDLFGISTDGSAVMQWTPTRTQPMLWTQIGGSAGALYGGDYGLFDTDPSTGDIYEYTGTPMSWTRIGSPRAN